MTKNNPSIQLNAETMETAETLMPDSQQENIIDFNEDNIQNPTTDVINLSHNVVETQIGERLDKIAAKVFEGFSRAQLQDWINSGNLTVNETASKPKYRVKFGDVIHLQAVLEQHGEDQPEDIDLDVVYEDDDVVVINKPVGMVVHPGAGNWTGTLVNGLLFHYPEQKHLPRAGLVHRIDKDTSGLLIVAKNKTAQLNLMEQLKDKSVYRHYQCIVAGAYEDIQRHRVIDLPIARHRTQRIKMCVQSGGRDSITHITNISELAENYCLLDIALETGRTHQIRVHLSHLGYPLVGDYIYGGRQQLRAGLTTNQREYIQAFPRQALHAYELGFVHPTTQEEVLVSAPLPNDMLNLIDIFDDEKFDS